MRKGWSAIYGFDCWQGDPNSDLWITAGSQDLPPLTIEYIQDKHCQSLKPVDHIAENFVFIPNFNSTIVIESNNNKKSLNKNKPLESRDNTNIKYVTYNGKQIKLAKKIPCQEDSCSHKVLAENHFEQDDWARYEAQRMLEHQFKEWELYPYSKVFKG